MSNNVVDLNSIKKLKHIEEVFTPKVYTMSEEEMLTRLLELQELFEEAVRNVTCPSCDKVAELQHGLCISCHEASMDDSDLPF